MLERNGFIVVSGCPRSGTSLCMDIQRVAHGDDAILGEKFPQEARRAMREEMRQRQDDEPEHEHRVRAYLMEKADKEHDLELDPDEERWRDMNPDGFWEMTFTVPGIIYRPIFREMMEKVRNGEETKICKVVSQGLMASDPIYIGKILFMIRHPRAVAKSQERLVRGFNIINPEGRVQNIFEGMTIHSPDMFINVTARAARFFLNNPNIPVHFFHFEELVSNPDPLLKEMKEFIGFGDYDKVMEEGVVKPKLNRSKHEDIEHTLWEDAEFVYDNICKAAENYNAGDHKSAQPYFEAILERMQNPRTQFNREHRNWRCFRAKRIVNENMCKLCMSDPNTRGNFLRDSESRVGRVAEHWSQEPCLFECGLDLDRDNYLTIEESIRHNFWRTGDPVMKVEYEAEQEEQ